jgi:hypothetical protein
MILMSEHFHARLMAPVDVTNVQTHGKSALAVLHSGTLPRSIINLEREHGIWKVAALIGDIQS